MDEQRVRQPWRNKLLRRRRRQQNQQIYGITALLTINVLMILHYGQLVLNPLCRDVNFDFSRCNAQIRRSAEITTQWEYKFCLAAVYLKISDLGIKPVDPLSRGHGDGIFRYWKKCFLPRPLLYAQLITLHLMRSKMPYTIWSNAKGPFYHARNLSFQHK